MRAQVIRQYGGSDVFEWLETDTLVPGQGQVLIRAHAASINPVDWMNRSGAAPLNPPMPATLGCDVAGSIAAVGEGVEDFSVGDRVYGCVGGVGPSQGTYATHVLADARLIARIPDSVGFREAAALPLVTITTAEGLDDKAAVRKGESVLVFGGTGGVGHVVTQWAAARGAVVHVTASTAEKAAIARDLGAVEVHNHRTIEPDQWKSLAPGGMGYDVVYDTVGGDNLQKSFQAARTNGRVVTTFALTTQDLSAAHMSGLSLGVVFMLIPLLHGVGLERHGRILAEAAEMLADGRLRPLLDEHRFTLDQVGEAQAWLESGRAIGKVVIDI